MTRVLIVLALCCAFVASAAPGRAQDSGGPGDGGIYTARLKNGLNVIVVEDRAAPVVQTSVWYHFGSLNETAGKTGLAHALEHMMFRGTTDMSAGGLDDIVARLGAEMNGETTYDYTHYYFVMPADKMDVGLQIEADRMRNAALRQGDWSIERGAVLNEIDGDQSSPFFSLLQRVRAAAYPDEPNGRTPLGSRDDVARATASDIAQYYRQWYAPNNAALVVSGAVNHAEVFSRAQRYFGGIPSKALPPQPKTATAPAVRGATVESNLPFPFEVVDLAYAIPGDSEPGEPAMSVLSTLISNQRSPFYQALVQTNVALGIEAQSDTQLKGGLFNVFVVLNPGHSSIEAQTIFQSTMDNVLKNGYDPSLVTAAKRLTIAERMYSADSVTGIGDLAGYTYGIVGERVRDEDDRLASLTSSDLLAATKTYLAQPSVIGHLRSTSSQSEHHSQKSDATASDDFSKRIPNGPVLVPAQIQAEIRTPSTARSTLTPVQFTLSNGVRVIVQEKHDRPTFSLRGEIRSSPAFAPPLKEGIIRLASAVADYGSDKYPFAERRKQTDELGAFVETGAQFSARGMARDFAALADVLADGEEHPSFAEPWFSLERGQLANSIQSEENISGTMIERAYLNLLLAPDDPALRRPSALSVSAISRDDLLNFAKTYWRPDLTTIAVVGDVTPAQVKSSLESAFGSWKANGPAPDPRAQPLPPGRSGHGYVGTEANEVYVRLGAPAVSRNSQDYDTFLVMNQILGASGAFQSRLWQELRQKRGLVYSVGTSLQASSDRGDFRIEMQAPPAKVAAAVKLVRQQLRDLQEHPVTPTELSEAKIRLSGDALIAESSTDGQVTQLLDIAASNLPLDYYRTLNERYARIDAADVQRVAHRYFHPDDMIQVYAGPQGAWSSRAI